MGMSGRKKDVREGYEAIWKVEDWLRYWRQSKEQIRDGAEAMRRLGLTPRDNRPHDISIG